jgi:putative tributyrin esterase
MPLIHAHLFSNVLQKHVQMNVILPSVGKPPYPVLYLLHGLSDDFSTWQRRTSIERYVENLPLIVVMPDGFRGFYTDNHEGPAYGRYMIEDVLGFVERSFPAQKARAGRCIGGLSMGGYGALRLALAHPEMFVCASSHSGACHAGFNDPRMQKEPEFKRIFGPKSKGSVNDIHALVEKLQRGKTQVPKLHLDCGTEDFLLEHNRAFIAHLKKLEVAHHYAEYPGGHSWDYWDLHVREALEFHCKALGI